MSTTPSKSARITPAGAGKTDASTSPAGFHLGSPPQVRGKLSFFVVASQPPGSPPQVRGKRRSARFGACARGITPAGAGKTASCKGLSIPNSDHPRRCGENKMVETWQPVKHGSPPQVRGKRPVLHRPLRQRGITPAGAGKTASSLHRCIPPQDHPRRCGENTRGSQGQACNVGSPPQVRGKQSKSTVSST